MDLDAVAAFKTAVAQFLPNVRSSEITILYITTTSSSTSSLRRRKEAASTLYNFEVAWQTVVILEESGFDSYSDAYTTLSNQLNTVTAEGRLVGVLQSLDSTTFSDVYVSNALTNLVPTASPTQKPKKQSFFSFVNVIIIEVVAGFCVVVIPLLCFFYYRRKYPVNKSTKMTTEERLAQKYPHVNPSRLKSKQKKTKTGGGGELEEKDSWEMTDGIAVVPGGGGSNRYAGLGGKSRSHGGRDASGGSGPAHGRGGISRTFSPAGSERIEANYRNSPYALTNFAGEGPVDDSYEVSTESNGSGGKSGGNNTPPGPGKSGGSNSSSAASRSTASRQAELQFRVNQLILVNKSLRKICGLTSRVFTDRMTHYMNTTSSLTERELDRLQNYVTGLEEENVKLGGRLEKMETEAKLESLRHDPTSAAPARFELAGVDGNRYNEYYPIVLPPQINLALPTSQSGATPAALLQSQSQSYFSKNDNISETSSVNQSTSNHIARPLPQLLTKKKLVDDTPPEKDIPAGRGQSPAGVVRPAPLAHSSTFSSVRSKYMDDMMRTKSASGVGGGNSSPLPTRNAPMDFPSIYDNSSDSSTGGVLPSPKRPPFLSAAAANARSPSAQRTGPVTTPVVNKGGGDTKKGVSSAASKSQRIAAQKQEELQKEQLQQIRRK